MNGWQVMAAPLTIVVRLGVLLATMVVAASVFDRLWEGRPTPPRASEPPPARLVSEQAIVRSYNDTLQDGWPAGQLLTFMEAGRRAGTSGEHVRSVIARHSAR
jgi:hypothetical protein